MKAGFLPKHHEASVSKASAWAEAMGYVANICLSTHKLQQLNMQEQQLLRKVQAHCKVSGMRDTLHCLWG
jgi:predicted nucleic acid-binding Zn ribbon protein